MDLVQTLNAMMDKKIKDCSVALPAIVTASDAATQTVKVKVGIFDAEFDAAIEIEGIECLQLAMSDSVYFYQPVTVGTQGIIVVMDRSSCQWFNAGATTPQQSDGQRYHDLSDAVFIPGIQQQRLACNPETAGTSEFKNGNMRIALHPSGKIEIEGSSQEVISVLSAFIGHVSSLCTTLQGASLAVAGGGGGVASFAPGFFTSIKSDIDSDKNKLDTLKV